MQETTNWILIALVVLAFAGAILLFSGG